MPRQVEGAYLILPRIARARLRGPVLQLLPQRGALVEQVLAVSVVLDSIVERRDERQQPTDRDHWLVRRNFEHEKPAWGNPRKEDGSGVGIGVDKKILRMAR